MPCQLAIGYLTCKKEKEEGLQLFFLPLYLHLTILNRFLSIRLLYFHSFHPILIPATALSPHV